MPHTHQPYIILTPVHDRVAVERDPLDLVHHRLARLRGVEHSLRIPSCAAAAAAAAASGGRGLGRGRDGVGEQLVREGEVRGRGGQVGEQTRESGAEAASSGAGARSV